MNWDQFKTILWLRRQLSRNQWARGGVAGQILSILVRVVIVMFALGAFFGGIAVGAIAMAKTEPRFIMLAWAILTSAFLFMWMIGLLTELQRNETIDLQRLMHLPVLLGQVFVINFVASHVVFSVIVCVPAMLGLAIGLTISYGPALMLLIPLALAMVFMVSAWTYCLRGWLATLMANPRKRRSIIMGITFVFIIAAQAPNLLRMGNGFQFRSDGTTRHSKSSSEMMAGIRTAAAAQKFIPPYWLPVGARALTEGRVLPALAGTLGCFLIGVLGLRRAYTTTVRFYHGEDGTRAAPPPPAATETAAAAPPRETMLEARIRGIPDEAAALAAATLRSMLRAPEVKMAWGSNVLVAFVIGATLFMGNRPALPDAAKPFIATAATCFGMFMLFQFFSNLFGYDREGFRALVLAPTDRRHILLGKNLANLPAAFVCGIAFILIAAIGTRIAPLDIAATLFQLLALFVAASLLGNLVSILAPYRIQAGSMKAAKMPALSIVMLIGFQLLSPLVFAPVFLAPLLAWLWGRAALPPHVPVNLIVSATLALAALALYHFTLAPMARLLARRQIKILNTVTSPVE